MKTTTKQLGLLILIAGLFSGCSKEKLPDDAALRMQQFVTNISTYAKSCKPEFKPGGFMIYPNQQQLLQSDPH